ncbi:MAG: type 4a pilus biogenesis protein PilO [Burkholderiaceae bacterium]
MKNIDITAIKAEFEGLNGRHPGLWPTIPKTMLLVAGFALLCFLAYMFYWKGLWENLEATQTKEVKLRADFQKKMKQAVNLPELRKQKEQVAQYVSILEKQLPSKAEMDALLSDINQAGVGRGLQFELFQPQQVVVRDYYAELPISIRLVGGFHELGHFTSDVANLPRIVTLNNVGLKRDERSGQLIMEAIAKTYRYLDQDEVAMQRAAQAKSNTSTRRR